MLFDLDGVSERVRVRVKDRVKVNFRVKVKVRVKDRVKVRVTVKVRGGRHSLIQRSRRKVPNLFLFTVAFKHKNENV